MTEDVARELERREQFIQGLRNMAAFFEHHPGVAVPHYNTFSVFVDKREELVEQAKLTSWKKVYNEQWFVLVKEFGGGVELHVNADRTTVCRRVVIGKKTVPARAEHEVDEVEWVCEEQSLLATK